MFDPEEFLKRPPQEILDTLRALSLTRDELVVLARHLEIEPKTSSTKPEIRQLILPVLITKTIVGEESDKKTEDKENTETSTMMIKTRNYDQEFELEKLKLQMEAKRQEREHIEKLEKMRIEEEREKERERQEKERERERQERESARQIQEREKERQFELEKLKLQQSNHPIGQSFDVIKNFQAVPSFQEDDVDMFFLHFEKLATNLNWPKITGLYCCRKLLLERHEKSLLSCQSNSHRSMNMSKMLFFVATN